MSCQLQRFRVYQILVGWRDGEDDAVGLGNILGDEVAGLLLNVCRLVANRNL